MGNYCSSRSGQGTPRADQEISRLGGPGITAALNSAVFTDALRYIPKVRARWSSNHFRINAADTGSSNGRSSSRNGSYVSYLEGYRADRDRTAARRGGRVDRPRRRADQIPTVQNCSATRTGGRDLTSSRRCLPGQGSRSPDRWKRFVHHPEIPQLHPAGDNSVAVLIRRAHRQLQQVTPAPR
jgi:hypothetical protein